MAAAWPTPPTPIEFPSVFLSPSLFFFQRPTFLVGNFKEGEFAYVECPDVSDPPPPVPQATDLVLLDGSWTHIPT